MRTRAEGARALAVVLMLVALGFAEQLGGDRIEETGRRLAGISHQIRSSAGLE